jgi:hypothetical protein
MEKPIGKLENHEFKFEFKIKAEIEKHWEKI